MRGKTNMYDIFFRNSIDIVDQNAEISENDFTASGGLTYQFYKDEKGTWELVLLTSGTITFNKSLNVDIWLVGGGANGATGTVDWAGDNWNGHGGKGGDGGQCVYEQVSIEPNTSYSITIGNNTTNTSAFGKTAISGSGCKGGNGAHCNAFANSNGSAASAGTTSLYYAFYEMGMSYFYPTVRFGAGGGGGGARGYTTTNYYYNGVTAGKAGGLTGGGNGGNGESSLNGTNGTPHYGAGGGGAGAASSSGTGGTGGTGIVIIHPRDFEEWYFEGLFAMGQWDTATIGSWAMRSSGSSSGWSNGGVCNITDNSLVIGTTSGGAHTSVYGTENTINLSNYNLLNVQVTSYTNGSSQDTNNVKLALSSSKTVSNWNPGAYGSTNPSGVVSGKTVAINGSGIFSIDISDITTSYYIWLTSASHSQVLTVIEKIWLS